MAVAKGQMMSARVESQTKAVLQAAAQMKVWREKMVMAYCRGHGSLSSGELDNALRTSVRGSGE